MVEFMRQTLYYWYTLIVFHMLYKRDCWITSTYYKGSCNTRRMKSGEDLKQYLKVSKLSVKRHYISNIPLNENQLHRWRF
jgi:hypothetical protein